MSGSTHTGHFRDYLPLTGDHVCVWPEAWHREHGYIATIPHQYKLPNSIPYMKFGAENFIYGLLCFFPCPAKL